MVSDKNSERYLRMLMASRVFCAVSIYCFFPVSTARRTRSREIWRAVLIGGLALILPTRANTAENQACLRYRYRAMARDASITSSPVGSVIRFSIPDLLSQSRSGDSGVHLRIERPLSFPCACRRDLAESFFEFGGAAGGYGGFYPLLYRYALIHLIQRPPVVYPAYAITKQ